MRHFFVLIRFFLYLGFKEKSIYRGDFFFGLLTALISQAINISVLVLIFSWVDSIKGWNMHSVMMIFGMSQVCLGLSEIFTENLWWLSNYTKSGALVRYTSTPLNPLFYLMFEKIHLDRLLNSLVGLSFFIIGYSHYPFSVAGVVGVINFSITGTLICVSMLILGSSIVFITLEDIGLISYFNTLSDFSKYPASIFPKSIYFLLVSFVPIGLIAYFPVSFILEPSWLLWTYINIISGIFFYISIRIWFFALRKYEPTGT